MVNKKIVVFMTNSLLFLIILDIQFIRIIRWLCNFPVLSRRDHFYLDLQSLRVISSRARNLLVRSLITFEMTLLLKAKCGYLPCSITTTWDVYPLKFMLYFISLLLVISFIFVIGFYPIPFYVLSITITTTALPHICQLQINYFLLPSLI